MQQLNGLIPKMIKFNQVPLLKRLLSTLCGISNSNPDLRDSIVKTVFNLVLNNLANHFTSSEKDS